MSIDKFIRATQLVEQPKNRPERSATVRPGARLATGGTAVVRPRGQLPFRFEGGGASSVGQRLEVSQASEFSVIDISQVRKVSHASSRNFLVFDVSSSIKEPTSSAILDIETDIYLNGIGQLVEEVFDISISYEKANTETTVFGDRYVRSGEFVSFACTAKRSITSCFLIICSDDSINIGNQSIVVDGISTTITGVDGDPFNVRSGEIEYRMIGGLGQKLLDLLPDTIGLSPSRIRYARVRGSFSYDITNTTGEEISVYFGSSVRVFQPNEAVSVVRESILPPMQTSPSVKYIPFLSEIS